MFLKTQFPSSQQKKKQQQTKTEQKNRTSQMFDANNISPRSHYRYVKHASIPRGSVTAKSCAK